MSPIRSLEELESFLTEDIKWRLHEMDQWERVADRARTHELPGLLRGGLALVYAHWEGYVKSSARAYIEYVARKGLRLGELRAEIAAIALRGMLGQGEASKKSHDHTDIVLAIRSGDNSPANLQYNSAIIRTYSNLNFENFADIMHSIGCDATRHEIYLQTIDSRLLRHRNNIAHGREDYVTLDDWRDIKVRVTSILKDVRTQISNAAAQGTYRNAAIVI
jgi:hypothetical protein